MILPKSELLSALHDEVRIILHLLSHATPDSLDYRPSPAQRSLLELAQYLVVMPPIHLRAALSESFDPGAWRSDWTTGEAAAREMTLDQVKEAIAAQALLFTQFLEPCPDEYLNAPIEILGRTLSRAATVISLVLCHYTAYRMQLFLYLKASGLHTLSTFNLWMGQDKP